MDCNSFTREIDRAADVATPKAAIPEVIQQDYRGGQMNLSIAGRTYRR